MLPNKTLPKVEYSKVLPTEITSQGLTDLSPHGASLWRLAWCSCHEGNCRTYQSSNYQLMTWLPKLGPRKIKVTKSHEVTIYICICTQADMTAEMPGVSSKAACCPAGDIFHCIPDLWPQSGAQWAAAYPDPHTRTIHYIQHTTLLKATTVTKEGSILLVLIYDLETHLPN